MGTGMGTLLHIKNCESPLAQAIGRTFYIMHLKDERPIAKAIVDGVVLPHPNHPTMNTVDAAREHLRHIDAALADWEKEEAERRERISSATLLSDEYWQYQGIRKNLTFIHGVMELIVFKTAQGGYTARLNDLKKRLERCNATDSRAELLVLNEGLLSDYMNLAEDMRQNIPDFAEMLATLKTQCDAMQTNGVPISEFKGEAKERMESTEAGVSFLMHDRMKTQAANRKRGKENREKAVFADNERQRAERDIETALERVAADPNVNAGKHGAIIAACRRVCSRFATLTDSKKNAPTYLPLTQADGTPLKPETLARYYREAHKAKRGKK